MYDRGSLPLLIISVELLGFIEIIITNESNILKAILACAKDNAASDSLFIALL